MSITVIWSAAQPRLIALPRRSYWADRGLGVVDDLLEAGLADVQKRRSGQVGGGHL
jgi:hypothetical protein